MPFELEIIGVKYYHVVISCLDRTDIRLRVVSKASKQGKEAPLLFIKKKKRLIFGENSIQNFTKQGKEAPFFLNVFIWS
jgi:hypothetical protein